MAFLIVRGNLSRERMAICAQWSKGVVTLLILISLVTHLCICSGASSRKRTSSTKARRKTKSDNMRAMKTSDANDPFEDFAKYLLDSEKGDGYEDYELKEVKRAVKKLASGQSAIKTMDGAAHKFRAAFSDR